MRFPIEMYKIRQEEVKIKIPCERCMNSGIVDRSCKKCGGNGVHNKTIKVWKVAPKTETVVNIDRSSKDSFYKGIQTSYEGGLRYWTGMNEFYKEEDKYLHFTKKDAQDECNRRNKDVADILKVDSNNKTIKNKSMSDDYEHIKQWKSDVMDGFCRYDASSFEELVINVRNKSINDFVTKIKKYMETTEQATYIDEINNGNDNYSAMTIYDYVDELANKLKEGITND